jgi:PAS domain S-box-containing protein
MLTRFRSSRALRKPPAREGRGEGLLARAERVAHLGFWEWDLVTGTHRWSEGAWRLSGHPAGSVPLTLSFILSTVVPEDRPAVQAALQRTIGSGAPLREEFRVTLPDGRVQWRCADGEIEEAGAARGLRCVLQDVTAQKRREVTVTGEREVLESIASGAPLAGTLAAIVDLVEDRARGMLASILLVDAEGRVHVGAAPSLPDAWNRLVEGEPIGPAAGSCGTAAWRRETVVCADIATDPLWEQYRAGALAHGLAACWSTPLFASDGRVVGTFALYYTRPRDPRPEEARVVTIACHLAEIAIARHASELSLREANDRLEQRVVERTEALERANAGLKAEIEARGRAERELSDRERRLAEAQRLAHCGSWDWDAETRQIRWSEELFRITGVAPETFDGSVEAAIRAFHPDDRERVRAHAAAAIGAGRGFSGEARIVRPDGEVRTVALEIRVVAEAGGALRAVEGTCADVTEKVRSEAEIRHLNAELEARVVQRTRELEAANRELTSFSYSVSHDLRAPLRSIEGFSRLLMEDHAAALGPDGRRLLERVSMATHRMAQLIDDLLQLAGLSRAEVTHRRVDLSAMARDIAESLRVTGPARDVTWDIAPGLAVEGDPRLLRVVLENLLGNAWKYTSRHASAHIQLGWRCEGATHVYFVHDDGAGFDPAGASQLFEPFRRLHRRDEFEGTGVGLATVRRIVERHGGRIWAEGAVEHGATFSFTLHETPPAPSGR